MKCKGCELIKSENLIYEDEKVIAVLSETPANYGHIVVLPKKHYTIIEQVPDFEMAHIGVVVNKLSIALFESMKIQGTNIFIGNGVAAGQNIPHLIVHIIPRTENDGINLNWQPRQLSEEEMSTVELLLNEETNKIGEFEQEKAAPIDMDKEQDKEKIPQEKDQENYMIKQLDRMP